MRRALALAGACLSRASRSLLARARAPAFARLPRGFPSLGLAARFACLLSVGCVTYDSGLLAAVSVETLPLPTSSVAERVEGRSCAALGEERLGRAIDDAIAKAPGANALVDVSLSFERLCLVVRGEAVRVEGARATP